MHEFTLCQCASLFVCSSQMFSAASLKTKACEINKSNNNNSNNGYF